MKRDSRFLWHAKPVFYAEHYYSGKINSTKLAYTIYEIVDYGTGVLRPNAESNAKKRRRKSNKAEEYGHLSLPQVIRIF